MADLTSNLVTLPPRPKYGYTGEYTRGPLMAPKQGWVLSGKPVSEREALHAFECYASALERRAGETTAILGMDTPWPLHDVLSTLISGAEHLLRDHMCDAHGHENLQRAVAAGKRMHAELLQSQVKTGAELLNCGPGTPWDRLCGEPSCAYCGAARIPKEPQLITGKPVCTKHGVELAFEGDECWACKEDAT